MSTYRKKRIIDIQFPKEFEREIGFDVMTLESVLMKFRQQQLFCSHRVHFYQFLLITEGSGILIVDFQECPYKKGTLFPIAKNQLMIFEDNPDARGDVIHFTEQFLYKNSDDLQLLSNLLLFDSYLCAPFVQLNTSTFNELREISCQMQREIKQEKDFAKEVICHSLLKRRDEPAVFMFRYHKLT